MNAFWSALLPVVLIFPLALLWSRKKEETRTLRLVVMAGAVTVTLANAAFYPDVRAISIFVIAVALGTMRRDLAPPQNRLEP